MEETTLQNGKKLRIEKIKSDTWYHLTVIGLDGETEVNKMFCADPATARDLQRVIAELVSRNQ